MKMEVYPTETKLQLQLALMQIVSNFDFIDSIYEANIKGLESNKKDVLKNEKDFLTNENDYNIPPYGSIPLKNTYGSIPVKTENALMDEYTYQDSLDSIKNLVSHGWTQSRISKYLTDKDYPTSKGGKWHSGTVCYLIKKHGWKQ
tara:strand:- start:711 stop:1145 length:435 start_codon:yes stop_codon:yes gene_type:complete